MKTMTGPQTKLFEKLPEAFQIHEAFSKSNAPGTEIRNLAGETLFSLTTGEPRSLKGLMSSDQIVMVERISSANDGGDNASVWMRA